MMFFAVLREEDYCSMNSETYELEVFLHLTQHPGTWALFPFLAQTYGMTFHSSLTSIIHFSKPDVWFFYFYFQT